MNIAMNNFVDNPSANNYKKLEKEMLKYQQSYHEQRRLKALERFNEEKHTYYTGEETTKKSSQ